LLARGGGDIADQGRDAVHALHDLLHRAAGVVGATGAFLHAPRRIADERLDLGGGRRAAQRQVAHFARDDREAASLLAGPRRFHGGVEGENVGLEGDAVDRADDLGDPGRALADAAHGADDLVDFAAAALRDLGRADRDAARLAGAAAGVIDGGGHLFHRGGGLLEARGLLLGARREIARACRDL